MSVREILHDISHIIQFPFIVMYVIKKCDIPLFQNQWEVHDGKCGVCGDPWQGPREHEAGGKFANGIIVKQYEIGEMITVTVELTANHKGWFEFRICKNNNPGKRVTHECLDKNLLKLADGGTRFKVYGKVGYGVSEKFEIKLQLPQDLICTQCVLQWKYNAGKNLSRKNLL